MSIMPNQSPRFSMPPAAREIVFWFFVILFAVGLWRTVSVPRARNHSDYGQALIAAIIVIGAWVFASLVFRKFRRRAPPKNPENRPLG